MTSIIPQRVCKKCSNSFPLTSDFWHKDKKAKEGLSYSCKECARARAKGWHYDNQEVANQRSREYYESHLEERRDYIEANAEHIAKIKREWRQNNPDKVSAQKKRSYARHKEHILAYHKEWYQRNRSRVLAIPRTPEQKKQACLRTRAWAKANPDKKLNHHHMRRARKAGNGGDGFEKTDKELQLRSQKDLCWWCSKPMGEDITIDHVVPLSRGGKHDPRNIVLCHGSCNSSKHDKLPQEWVGRLF